MLIFILMFILLCPNAQFSELIVVIMCVQIEPLLGLGLAGEDDPKPKGGFFGGTPKKGS
jgi:hypothetical protein